MANGHLAKSGCSFWYAILPTGESDRRFSAYPPSDRSIGPALIAWQSGILQSKDARFCMLILLIGESNHRFSVQTFLDRSIGHALVAWQSGILQSRGARFCMLPFRSGSLIADSASIPLRLQHRPCACRIAIGYPAKSGCPFLYLVVSSEGLLFSFS